MTGKSVKQLLQESASHLATVTETPALEARLLLCEALNKTQSWLIAWSEQTLTGRQNEAFNALLAQRLQGIPVAHILQHRAFWTLDLKVTPDTLIPRPDTETLVAAALTQLDAQAPLHVIDLGTGSGAIALALASERPHWQIHATDISEAALAIAKNNAKTHQLNIQFHLSDWFDALPAAQKFDLIISNPPYICENDPHLKQGDVRFDPQLALTSGADGLDAIRHIVSNATTRLNSNGMLLLEHGYDQADAVRILMHNCGYSDISCHSDHGGKQRATCGIHKKTPINS